MQLFISSASICSSGLHVLSSLYVFVVQPAAPFSAPAFTTTAPAAKVIWMHVDSAVHHDRSTLDSTLLRCLMIGNAQARG